MDLQNICTQVQELARSAGAFIQDNINKVSSDEIEIKAFHNYVTYVDKESEKMLVKGLQKILPESGFIAEEKTTTKRGDTYNWIVDPLDGTTNYIHRLPPYSVSIALMEKDEIILGVVYEISMDESFCAWKGSKAYMNGSEIKVSDVSTIKDSFIGTGFPYYDYERINEYVKSLVYFMQHSVGIRRFGSAAADLAYVACGRFDAFYEYSLSSWDVAAGSLIVKQAGGRVCDFKGKDNYIFGKEILAGNAMIFEELLSILTKFMHG